MKTIYQFLKQPVEEQKEAWFDWWCPDSRLPTKTLKLVALLRQLTFSPKININQSYVLFKNNCPLEGNLYDDFRICDLKAKKVLYCIVPVSGHTVHKGRSEVWDFVVNPDAQEPVVTGTWNDVKAYFGV